MVNSCLHKRESDGTEYHIGREIALPNWKSQNHLNLIIKVNGILVMITESKRTLDLMIAISD